MVEDKDNGMPGFLVQWKNVYEDGELVVEMVPNHVLKVKAPQEVIKFYESQMDFHLNENEPVELTDSEEAE